MCIKTVNFDPKHVAKVYIGQLAKFNNMNNFNSRDACFYYCSVKPPFYVVRVILLSSENNIPNVNKVP
jgi:hypothetical protein